MTILIGFVLSNSLNTTGVNVILYQTQYLLATHVLQITAKELLF